MFAMSKMFDKEDDNFNNDKVLIVNNKYFIFKYIVFCSSKIKVDKI